MIVVMQKSIKHRTPLKEYWFYNRISFRRIYIKYIEYALGGASELLLLEENV